MSSRNAAGFTIDEVTEVRTHTLQLQRLPVKPRARSTSKRTAPQWQEPV